MQCSITSLKGLFIPISSWAINILSLRDRGWFVLKDYPASPGIRRKDAGTPGIIHRSVCDRFWSLTGKQSGINLTNKKVNLTRKVFRLTFSVFTGWIAEGIFFTHNNLLPVQWAVAGCNKTPGRSDDTAMFSSNHSCPYPLSCLFRNRLFLQTLWMICFRHNMSAMVLCLSAQILLIKAVYINCQTGVLPCSDSGKHVLRDPDGNIPAKHDKGQAHALSIVAADQKIAQLRRRKIPCHS